MKIIAFITALMLSGQSLAAYTPISIKGQEDASKSTITNIVVPNKQATEVGTKTYLLEGYKNLLANPSFEATISGSVVPSWNIADSARSAETSDVIDGKQSLKAIFAGDPVNLYQDSTINVTGLSDGVQGIAYLRVKNGSDQTLYLCGRSVGTTASVSNCATIPNTNKWIHAKLSVILGGTSNGIALTSNGAFTTGTILVDDAFLGAQDVKQDAISVEVQSATFAGATTVAVTSGTFTATPTIKGSGLFTVSSGNYTFLKSAVVDADFTLIASSTGRVQTSIYKNGTLINRESSESVAGIVTGASVSIEVEKDDVLTFVNNGGSAASNAYLTLVAQSAQSTSILSTAADSFSTDTHTLTHKTTAITSTDPVGTYNTYSYAINSNTKTICGAAPTTAPTKADGFLIYTRAYNAASTCGNPARVEIKIAEAGTTLPSRSVELYKSAAKTLSGETNYFRSGSDTEAYGLRTNAYDEKTGVLVVDAGNQRSSNTATQFIFTDNTVQTSGYLVINAQKMKDSVVGSFKDFDYVEVEGAGNNGAAITASTTNINFTETSDSDGAWNGTQFTTPAGKGGKYDVKGLMSFTASISGTTYIYIDGVQSKAIGVSQGTSQGKLFSGTVTLEDGEVLSIRHDVSGTLLNTSVGHHISITRIPGQF